MTKPAILALADGSIFHGQAIGREGCTVGEVVFNTAMCGYQESLTDPASAGHMIAFTYPHLGNTGVNTDDAESDKVWATGVIIRDLPLLASSWRCERDLASWLDDNAVVGIAGIDTRKLTRILRDKGVQSGCILSGEDATAEKAIELAKQHAQAPQTPTPSDVTTQQTYEWSETDWQLEQNACPDADVAALEYPVVVYDFGVTRSLLRALTSKGCRVTVVPAHTAAHEALALRPKGIVLSGGPGNPEACAETINTIKALLETDVPVFATGLGFQLMALASGASCFKLKCGQYGANQPVQDVTSKQSMITVQNSAYAVSADNLPANLQLTHVSLFEKAAQGLKLEGKPAFGFQGIPQPSNEPNSSNEFFARFIEAMQA